MSETMRGLGAACALFMVWLCVMSCPAEVALDVSFRALNALGASVGALLAATYFFPKAVPGMVSLAALLGLGAAVVVLVHLIVSWIRSR